MTNITLHAHMINRYNELAYTHNYIWGFALDGVVYMATTGSDLMPYITCLDKASRGQGYSLRFKPNKEQKMLLMPHAEPLCSLKFFEELFANTKYNRGEIFEKLVTEKFGQVWVKDNIPFTKAGDIEVDGVAYQIKFQKATFTNEKALADLC